MGSFRIKCWPLTMGRLDRDPSPLHVPHHPIRPPVPKKGEDGVFADGHTTVRCTQPISFTSSHHRPRRGPPKPPLLSPPPHAYFPTPITPCLKASSRQRAAVLLALGQLGLFCIETFLNPTRWPTRVKWVRPQRRLLCTRTAYIIRRIMQWVDQFQVRDLECVPFADFGADRLFRSYTKQHYSYKDERYGHLA
ncbi:hypothetical protein BHM03_00000216 [Ensete ventricosum]|nr:hypothetical protein BHM03_00000216 [Ensete ventricosum]